MKELQFYLQNPEQANPAYGLVTNGGSRVVAPRSWTTPHRHFSEALQNDWYRLVFRLLRQITYSTMDFFRERDMSPALLPITCGSISSPMGLGSDSLPVEVDLFGRKTYLADSMQFQLEYMLRHDCAGVFYIMPTFRGETPDSRHLNQFFHAEAEIRGGLSDVMDCVSRYVTRLTSDVYRELGDLLRVSGIGTEHLFQMLSINSEIPKISYREAKKVLGSKPEYYDTLPGGVQTLSRLGEKVLMKEMGGIVWLTHLPHKAVPFYQAKTADGEYAKCADLLFGIGEVVGCGERHTTYGEVLGSLEEHHVDPAQYEWYLRMKKEFPMQTAGFGLGVERFLLWVLKHNDIRDVCILSRLKGQDYAP